MSSFSTNSIKANITYYINTIRFNIYDFIKVIFLFIELESKCLVLKNLD